MNSLDRLYDAALDQFVEQGLSASVSSITKRAGLSSGLVFYYFQTKEEFMASLYKKCMRDQMDEAKKQIDAAYAQGEIGYREYSESSFKSIVKWKLSNWKKHQYMKLYESSQLAGQYDSEGDEAGKAGEGTATELEPFSDVALVGREEGYISDLLPDDFSVSVFTSIADLTASYLHDHPAKKDRTKFLASAWLSAWYSTGGKPFEEKQA